MFKTGIKYGAIAFAGYVVYFLIMKALGLEHNYWLRTLNIIIEFAAVFYAVREIKRADISAFHYLRGFGTGLYTGFSSALFFGLFVLVYLLAIDPAFMESVRNQEFFGRYLNPALIFVVIVLEGTMAGLICSQIAVTILKKDTLQEVKEKETA